MKLAKPGACRAAIHLPGDKSITHRAVMLAAIASGRTRILNANHGADVRATIEALRKLGVDIRAAQSSLVVSGRQTFVDPESVIDCGNSGTTMRLLMGLLAGRANAQLDGDPSLRKRPMARVSEPLTQMGALVTASRDGRPPVRIRRSAHPLRALTYRLPVASAQVKSALLFAALIADGPSTLTSPNVTRDHSERMLRAMGARLRTKGKTTRIYPSALHSQAQVRIPGDFSAAVYLMCAAAALPGSRLRLLNISVNPTRTAALNVMRAMGAHIDLSNRRTHSGEPVATLRVAGGAPLHGVIVAKRLVPNLVDEIPALCALAAAGRGVFRVRGASELRIKESDRIATTVALLRSFGVDAAELADGIEVRGGKPLCAPKRVDTRGDHRIGMAAAILAVATRSPLTIVDADCIATSFPNFAATWHAAFCTHGP